MENDEMEEDLNSTTNAMSNLSLNRNTQQQIIHDLNHRLVQIRREIEQINTKLNKNREEYYSILEQDLEEFEGGDRHKSHLLVEYEWQKFHFDQNKKDLKNEMESIKNHLSKLNDNELSKNMSNLSLNHKNDRGSGGSTSSSSTHFHRRGF
uniref:Uncharacterized protein n=1 Tax=Meloidogyne floridensis TaxID=298350 RepID=A0A915PAL3_9BILA